MRDADSEIRRELMRGEELLWAGQARQGVVFHTFDFFLIPFSVVWCSFAVFWMVMAAATGAPRVFVLSGIPFVISGLFFVFGRFWVDARARANIFYGVTTDRVLIVSGVFRRQVKSLNIPTISDITLIESASGGGVITFGPSIPWFGWSHNIAWPAMSQFGPPSFYLATRAREVYSTINELRSPHRGKA